MSIMKNLVVITFLSAVAAQILVPQAASNDFPACALSCQPLLVAQTGCVPPSAPATDQAIYVSCFCQSTLIAQLHSTPDGTCDQWCPVESDRQELMAWYNNFCAAPVSTSPTTTVPGVTVAATSTIGGVQTTVVYVTTTSATGTSAPTDSSSSANSPASGGSWINTHWKWILMVVILLVGLSGLAILAVCLKRRYKRKAEEKRATLSGFPVEREKAGSRTSTANLESLFGPAQHMAATRGWEYPDESNKSAPAVASSEKRTSRRNSYIHSGRRGPDGDTADTIQESSTDRSISRKRQHWEREAERNKDIERRLRGAKSKDIERLRSAKGKDIEKS